jgi:hypothetical protein
MHNYYGKYESYARRKMSELFLISFYAIKFFNLSIRLVHSFCTQNGKVACFFNSSRGGKKVSLEGYIFSKDKSDEKTGKTYWKCELRSCRGRLITNHDNRILKESEHNHGPDHPLVDLQMVVARIKDRASTSENCPSRLLNKELLTNFPAPPPIPKSLSEIIIEDTWRVNNRGEQFLLCDRGEGND